MTETDLERAVLNAVAVMRYDNPTSEEGFGGGKTPRRTGNLADNGIQYEQISTWEWRIYMDTDVAPYMVYLNDDPKSRHYQWWDAQSKKLIENIAKFLGGTMK